MTWEEKISWLKQIENDIYVDSLGITYEEYMKSRAIHETIEALQKEPCEDTISREKVLKEIDTVCFSNDWKKFRINNGSNGERDYIINFIKQMSSVQPEQRWIPCKERMPENRQFVLFCDIDGNIMIGYHVNGRSDTHFTEKGSWEDIKNVRAWMPLPEPYKEKEEIKL